MPLVPIPEASHGVEIHLDLGSVQGESTSTVHKDEIEISTFQWVVSNSPINTKDGAIKGGRVSMTEISLTKAFDKASVLLVKAAATGQTFKTAKITWSKSTGGKTPEDFFIITLTGALITSVQQNSTRSGQWVGTETITLSFDKISMDYKVQGKTGLLASAGQMSYDLAQGRAS